MHHKDIHQEKLVFKETGCEIRKVEIGHKLKFMFYSKFIKEY